MGTNSPHHVGRGMPVADDPFERGARPLEVRGIVREPRVTGMSTGHDGREQLVDFMSDGPGELRHIGDRHGGWQLAARRAHRRRRQDRWYAHADKGSGATDSGHPRKP